MTAILAYADGKSVWMGGDSAALNGGWDRFISHDKKVFKKSDLLIGSAGSKRVQQLIKYEFEVPEHTKYEDLEMFFIKPLWQFLKGYDLTLDDDQGGNDFLVGYQGELYYITGDYACSRISRGAYTVGSGGDLALGAFEAFFNHENFKPEEAIHSALCIAGQHNLTVAAPYYVEKI